MWRKLLFFGSLYFVQGAALSYIINFQKPFLYGHGVSKEAIGLFTSLLLVPFIAKVGLGYLSDRFPIGRWGSRKPYMFIGLTLFGASFAFLSLLNPGDAFMPFAITVWFASLGLAWFDACADGMACDVAKTEEQSAIQAAMITGKSLGLTLMALLFGQIAFRYGFGSVFLTIAGLAFLILLLVLTVSFPKTTVNIEVVHGWRDVLKGSFLFFGLFGVMYSISSFGTDGLVTLHFTETLGADALGVGRFGMIKGLGGMVGAVTYAILRSRIGLKPTQFLTLVLLGFGCLLPLTALAGISAAPLWGFCWGMGETGFVTIAMQFAKGRWAATIFALAMIFSNLGTSIGEGIGAPLVNEIGYEGVFTLYAVLAWASTFAVWKVFKLLK